MIKGLIKKDHIGIVVPDMTEAINFFKKFFNAKIIGKANNFSSDDDWMKEHLNVNPRAVIEKLTLIQLFDDSIIELFQYTSPDQKKEVSKNSDYSGYHIAFEVNDIEESVSFLKRNNIKVCGSYTYNNPSLKNISGALKGVKWIYFESPWGMTFELTQKNN
ncbi:VOC family protein [Flavivirga abyssicola]|uniref:VOC family protein n=1 Tax=Flavivirga abyssicola TaxID=3063533 RepID=UPI0026DFF24D|nr:VOC family protein [Flavivirga sp. MEBiC07777]WVK13842.1 VOC family protein [Flavivirga sp. MEBiC07777]